MLSIRSSMFGSEHNLQSLGIGEDAEMVLQNLQSMSRKNSFTAHEPMSRRTSFTALKNSLSLVSLGRMRSKSMFSTGQFSRQVSKDSAPDSELVARFLIECGC